MLRAGWHDACFSQVAAGLQGRCKGPYRGVLEKTGAVAAFPGAPTGISWRRRSGQGHRQVRAEIRIWHYGQGSISGTRRLCVTQTSGTVVPQRYHL